MAQQFCFEIYLPLVAYLPTLPDDYYPTTSDFLPPPPTYRKIGRHL